MKPGITVGIGNGFIQFMGHNVSHGISAFISVRAESLGGASTARVPTRALRGGISNKGYFYVGGSDAVSKRLCGVKTAESSTKALGATGDGGESQGHVRRREDKIDSIGVHGKPATIERQKEDVQQVLVS